MVSKPVSPSFLNLSAYVHSQSRRRSETGISSLNHVNTVLENIATAYNTHIDNDYFEKLQGVHLPERRLEIGKCFETSVTELIRFSLSRESRRTPSKYIFQS